VFPALTTVALNSVRGHLSGLASGVKNAVSRAAALLAIAVLGVVMFAAFSLALDSRIANLSLSSEAAAALEEEKVNLGGAAVPQGVEGEQAVAIEEAVAESFVAGFRLDMLTSAGLSITSAIAAAILMQGKGPVDGSQEAMEHGQPRGPVAPT
jgi:hypothetical protein